MEMSSNHGQLSWSLSRILVKLQLDQMDIQFHCATLLKFHVSKGCKFCPCGLPGVSTIPSKTAFGKLKIKSHQKAVKNQEAFKSRSQES